MSVGDIVQLEELSFIELSPDGSLTILGAQPLDTGDYQCVAANDAGSTSDVVQLDVGCMFVHFSLPPPSLYLSVSSWV